MSSLVLWVLATVYINIKCTFGMNDRVRSPIPPLNMPLQDIPMFLTITIDDALYDDAHDKTELVMNHLNRNNEPIPLIYFVSNAFSDYSYVQKRYLEGCEIAVHTVTHTTSVSTDITKWYNEIKASRELLSMHSDIPLNEIVGFRAPFLEKSDITFQVLNGLDPPFLYDSTIINKLAFNDPPAWDWPYTLDQYEPGFVHTVGKGPKQSYPGLWEVPMCYLYSNITDLNSFIDPMDYIGTYNELLNIWKANFLHRMNTNKAPMGLYLHVPWFNNVNNVNAVNDFIDWALNFDNTWIVTNKDIINWINNPITASQYEYINNNQLINDKTNFVTCNYVGETFHTVLDTCPTELPHNLTYNPTDLVSSKITITSTNDNVQIVSSDICVNDTFNLYDSNSIYCNNPSIQNTVKYNNILYKCLWWTQGENPETEFIKGLSSVWILYKDCIQDNISFIKGIINPYSTQYENTKTVFKDSVLNIDVTINEGYDIPDVSYISVIVDNIVNSPQPLTYFEDFEFDKNNQTNTVHLIIRFIHVIDSEYEIKFSFKDLTLPPTRSPTIITNNPSTYPTFIPTLLPSKTPTQYPTNIPSKSPSYTPTNMPSKSPSYTPTKYPTEVTELPTLNPTKHPTEISINPTTHPSKSPSYNSISPTKYPTITPTETPTISDICQSEAYTVYDSNNIYCENGPDGEFVRYNNGLYQCKYRTQSEIPESVLGKSVWSFRKKCLDLVTTISLESTDGISDENDAITITMSYPIILYSIIGVGGIIFVIIVICIILCCIIRKQKGKIAINKYGMEEGLKSLQSVSIESTNMPKVPIHVNPMHQSDVAVQMSPKSI